MLSGMNPSAHSRENQNEAFVEPSAALGIPRSALDELQLCWAPKDPP